MGRWAQGAPRLSWAGDGTWPRDWTSRVCPSRVRLFPASLRPGPLEAGQGPGDRPPGRPPHTRWLPGLQPQLFKWKRLFPPRTKGAGHLCATVVPALARSRVTGGQVEVPGLRGPGRPSPDTASPPSPPQLCSARPPPSRAVGPCARPARPAPSAGTGTTALRGPWEVPGPGATSTSRFSPRAGRSARWAAETPATMMFRKSFQRPGKTMMLCRGRKVRKPNLRDRVAEGDPGCKR